MITTASDKRPASRVPGIWIGVALVLILGAVLRFWEIGTNFHFMGDEGQQAEVEWQLIHGHLPLLGPSLSIGSMHLGPLFYYLAAIPLWITGGSPIGPTVMVGIFGLAAVLVLFLYLRFPLGDWPALGASAVMAASFLMVEYSRRPWNPTPTPLFALLFLWSLVLWKRHSSRYVIMTAGTLAVLLQLQPVNIFLVVLLGVFVVLARPSMPSLGVLGVAAVLFLSIVSPLIIYDLTHSFANTQAWLHGLFGGGKKVSGGTHSSSPRVLFTLFNRAFEPRVVIVSAILCVALCIAAVYVAFVDNDANGANWEVILAIILVGIALVGFEVYRKEVFEQYLVCLFPVPFIFLAAFLRLLWRGRMLRWIAVAVTFALVTVGVRDVVQYSFLTPEVTVASAATISHDLQADDTYGHVLAVDRVIRRWTGPKVVSISMASPLNYVDSYAYVLYRVLDSPVGRGCPAVSGLLRGPTHPSSPWPCGTRFQILIVEPPHFIPGDRAALASKTIGMARIYADFANSHT